MAGDFLRATGFVLLAQAWARADAVAASGATAGEPFLVAKRDTARHCFDYVLPEFGHALAMVRAGWQPLAFVPASATA